MKAQEEAVQSETGNPWPGILDIEKRQVQKIVAGADRRSEAEEGDASTNGQAFPQEYSSEEKVVEAQAEKVGKDYNNDLWATNDTTKSDKQKEQEGCLRSRVGDTLETTSEEVNSLEKIPQSRKQGVQQSSSGREVVTSLSFKKRYEPNIL